MGTLLNRRRYMGGKAEEIDYSKQHLAFVALADGMTVTLTIHANVGTDLLQDVSYSVDNGATWVKTNNVNSTQVKITTTAVNSGKKVLFKGNGSSYCTTSQNNCTFSTNKNCNVEGNIMSLLYGDNFVGQMSLSATYCFRALFSSIGGLISAENMVLPATTLSDYCYYFLFYHSTNMVTPPKVLPAEILAPYCYARMFYDTKIDSFPSMNATTLAQMCFENMFRSTKITTAPQLPWTTLANGCYNNMFNGCTSLLTAPALPATTLADGCYESMFASCTALTTAPELPATTLNNTCYQRMFQNCTSLTTAPVLPAAKPLIFSYQEMFKGCSSLNYIKMMATDISSYGCLSNWVSGVAASGTFVKNSAASWTNTGASGVPDGWTVITADS